MTYKEYLREIDKINKNPTLTEWHKNDLKEDLYDYYIKEKLKSKIRAYIPDNYDKEHYLESFSDFINNVRNKDFYLIKHRYYCPCHYASCLNYEPDDYITRFLCVYDLSELNKDMTVLFDTKEFKKEIFEK